MGEQCFECVLNEIEKFGRGASCGFFAAYTSPEAIASLKKMTGETERFCCKIPSYEKWKNLPGCEVIKKPHNNLLEAKTCRRL
jgi:hypothetical protein